MVSLVDCHQGFGERPASELSWDVSCFLRLTIRQRRRPHIFRQKDSAFSAPAGRSKRTATSAATMPNFSGNWKIIRSENFEDLLKVLGEETFKRPPEERAPDFSVEGVNVMLRKIAVAAASKPAVEIKQEGDTFYIKTSTTVRTTEINFKIGEEFEEQTVDGRPCKSLVKWESENKMVCEQRLLKGEGPKTSWTRELTNDGELILTMTADDIVCTRVYVRE